MEIGDGWSSSEGGSELELDSDRRGTKWNFLCCKRFGTVAGDCGSIGGWAIRPHVVDSSSTGIRGRNLNLEAKAELAFEGTGEYISRKQGGCLDETAPPADEVFFDPTFGSGGGGWGDDGDVSGNKGSKPTGTRFKS